MTINPVVMKSAMPHFKLKVLLLLMLCTSHKAHGEVSILARSEARLPNSLGEVITAMEKEGSCTTISPSCLITSRSVTVPQTASLVEALMGSPESVKVAGSSSGFVLAQPDTVSEAAATACACGGSVVFYADPIDLARGEGLFERLAPVMESLVQYGPGTTNAASLVVIVPPGSESDWTKKRLEKVAELFLPTLVARNSISCLQDVFARVVYVTSATEAASLLLESKIPLTDALNQANLAMETSVSGDGIAQLSSAKDLTAARRLGPAARTFLTQAVKQVEQVCRTQQGDPKLVINFGELCDAASQQAIQSLEKAAGESSSVLASSIAGNIRRNFLAELDRELHMFFEEQINQLKLASFDDLKKGLSKLLISPSLANDMNAEAERSIASFRKASEKMVSKRCPSFRIQPSRNEFSRTVKEHVKKRLLTAKASGQYKALPRKGVQVGLHWLLPKPFGNDYRQEPWLVHATDNMVYIPKDKLTDVTPQEVALGDWRRKVVPSPIGNDMLYIQ